MTGALLVLSALVTQGALQLAMEPGGLTLRVPVRGEAGVPEVRSVPGEVVIELPEGRVDRASTTLVDEAGRGEAGLVREISASTSRSRHRAIVTLRLKGEVRLPPERVVAQLVQGVLVVRLLGEPAAPPRPAAAPVPAAAPLPPLTGAAAAAAPAAPRGAIGLFSGKDGEGAASSLTGNPAPAPGQRTPSEWAVRILPLLGAAGLGLWWLMRRRGARAVDIRPTAINVVATRLLGHGQRLMVVDVDRRRFLLSSSEQGGVRLLSQIGEGATGREIGEQAPSQGGQGSGDPLDHIFSDMLDEFSSGKQAPQRPAQAPVPAAAAASAAPAATATSAARPERPAPARPALQLVEDAPAEAKAPPRRDERPTAHEIGAHADVAGLLALRRYKQGAGR